MRADFYILKDQQQPWEIAYRLLEKAHQQQLKVFVYTRDLLEEERFDDFLWCYRADDFLPHARSHHPKADQIPIIIGSILSLNPGYTVLLNLNQQDIPENISSERIIELVSPTETEKLKSREHYRIYQKRGYVLNTHTL